MDDSCAVCAETLEWVAYGPCGHKDVCSNCVVRLRFICHDRCCCICKTHSDLVFVTKALGDYTRTINSFSVFPSELKEGRVEGSYWYHEDTQALFDDLDQYKMIKKMCRLSCTICDNMKEQPSECSRQRRPRFHNIEQLKGHLFHQHRILMCSLCLEARKVFICEQKLYTRAQLNQHIQTGNSEVDGTESERGGFMGHPICEFCKNPFYGDNELFSHMSTEHYTCHICQRQHPGQYEYYKNYDDLEIHFRQEHFLCEDDTCLREKFVVFTSESEIKRHNALKHGGSMSRSKRIAALQIPTSFRYRRGSEQGRGRTLDRDFSEDQIPLACESSYETSSSRNQLLSGDHFDPLVINGPLGESAFPPLPVAPRPPPGNRKIPKRLPKGPANYSASLLRLPRNANVGVSPVPPVNYWKLAKAQTSVSSSGPRNTGGSGSRICHFVSDFPPVSVAAQNRELQASDQTIPNGGDVHTAKKSLVKRIRSGLDFDEDKYNAFNEISGEYRHGVIDAETYLSYVDQFSLLHLVLELARFCSDPHRQKALIETYNANWRSNGTVEKGSSKGKCHREASSSNSKKGKKKCVDGADSVMDTMKKLQSSYKPSEEVAEVLLKDGCCTSKGKGKVMVDDESSVETSSVTSQPPSNSVLDGSSKNLGDCGGKGKK